MQLRLTTELCAFAKKKKGTFSLQYGLSEGFARLAYESKGVRPYPLDVLRANGYTIHAYSSSRFKGGSLLSSVFDTFADNLTDLTAMKYAMQKYRTLKQSPYAEPVAIFIHLHTTEPPFDIPQYYQQLNFTAFTNETDFGRYQNAVQFIDRFVYQDMINFLTPKLLDQRLTLVITGDRPLPFAADQSLSPQGAQQPPCGAPQLSTTKAGCGELLFHMIAPWRNAKVESLRHNMFGHAATFHTDLWPTVLDLLSAEKTLPEGSYGDGLSWLSLRTRAVGSVTDAESLADASKVPRVTLIAGRHIFHTILCQCPNDGDHQNEHQRRVAAVVRPKRRFCFELEGAVDLAAGDDDQPDVGRPPLDPSRHDVRQLANSAFRSYVDALHKFVVWTDDDNNNEDVGHNEDVDKSAIGGDQLLCVAMVVVGLGLWLVVALGVSSCLLDQRRKKS